jgi:hypothetical protein
MMEDGTSRPEPKPSPSTEEEIGDGGEDNHPGRQQSDIEAVVR